MSYQRHWLGHDQRIDADSANRAVQGLVLEVGVGVRANVEVGVQEGARARGLVSTGRGQGRGTGRYANGEEEGCKGKGHATE